MKMYVILLKGFPQFSKPISGFFKEGFVCVKFCENRSKYNNCDRYRDCRRVELIQFSALGPQSKLIKWSHAYAFLRDLR